MMIRQNILTIAFLTMVSGNVWPMIQISRDTAGVFSLLKNLLPTNPVILEAGALTGNTAKQMAKLWPDSEIHTFEPVPEHYANLVKNTSSFKNIITYPLALSDRQGTATFFVSERTTKPGKPSASGSLLSPKEHLNFSKSVVFPTQIAVTTTTIDLWVKEKMISKIDLMWLDMQGHELAALQHATTILPSVKLVYMEVEFVEAYEGQALYRDVKNWMALNGFEPIALDFDETQALSRSSTKKGRWYGNVLFANKKCMG